MFTDFIITFRETLEAALVTGIVLSYLSQTKNKDWFKIVFYAVIAGILASLATGIFFEKWMGGFTGIAEKIYEGSIMLIATGLISWMIIWMAKQSKYIKKNIHEKIDKHIQAEQKTGIFFIVFIAILREGIETVLFLKASALQNSGNSIIGASFGILVAIVLGYVIFAELRQISLKKFFSITTIILILFSAGLLAHGVHELQEAGWIPTIYEQVWDLNPKIVTEGVYPLLHEKGTIGGILKGLFGWNGNPTLLEVISYLIYLIGITGVIQSIKKHRIKK